MGMSQKMAKKMANVQQDPKYSGIGVYDISISKENLYPIDLKEAECLKSTINKLQARKTKRIKHFLSLIQDPKTNAPYLHLFKNLFWFIFALLYQNDTESPIHLIKEAKEIQVSINLSIYLCVI